jgi:hypothetical protein
MIDRGISVPLVGQDVAQGRKGKKISKFRRRRIYIRVIKAQAPSSGITSTHAA